MNIIKHNTQSYALDLDHGLLLGIFLFSNLQLG